LQAFVTVVIDDKSLASSITATTASECGAAGDGCVASEREKKKKHC
jgi:hypothetical protein